MQLKTSQTIRLARLFKGAVYKEDSGRLVLPVPKTPDLAGTLVDFLRQLIPPALAGTGPTGRVPIPPCGAPA